MARQAALSIDRAPEGHLRKEWRPWPNSRAPSSASSRRIRFWLASAPPTDKAYNVVARVSRAGWGGVVWKTLGEDGPPIVNVNGPRYGVLFGPDRRLIGFNNIELITDRPLEINLQEIKQVKREWPDRAVLVSLMVPCEGSGVEGDPAACRGHRLRRHRAQFRLPARHVRAGYGLGGRAGARIHRDGDALVQTETRACP